jgi:DNA-binding PadR family transcriptional regulator
MAMGRRPDTSPQTLEVLRALLEGPDDWHYGYSLSRRTGLRSGTLYPILIRLADGGWLDPRWVEPERPGRPPRHLYRLTPDGAREAASRLAKARARRPMVRPRRVEC